MVANAPASARTSLPTYRGLTAEEVRDRQHRGETNAVLTPASRSIRSILISNLFTRFNVLLGLLLVAILVIGPLQDALFGLVLIVNTPIGIFQELRAKWTLDRLTVIAAPTAAVIREGNERAISVADIVIDDIIVLRRGDQVAVDGEVLHAAELEIDESLLTGESAPLGKPTGGHVLSGTFVVAGQGLIRATAVGASSYGNRLALQARRFTAVRSEIRRGIDRFLLIIAALIGPTGALLVFSQVNASDTPVEAVRSSVAGIVTMIPEGLVLLTSVVFAVAALRFASHGIVTQELASVEMLARADVVCLDKTGTLTTGAMSVDHIVWLGQDADEARSALAALAAADAQSGSTLAALRAAMPEAPDWRSTTTVPFTSARRWSGATFAGRGSWVLGAPDVLATDTTDRRIREAAAETAKGHRVLLVGRATSPTLSDSTVPRVEPVALVVLREELRPDAAQTIAYYASQGIAVKVISGDHPHTVAAVAAAAGVAGADTPIAADDLPHDPDAFADCVERATVFGRVNPTQKCRIVEALRARGHVVAMTGDGVNDVLALKEADIGVAMGSGAPAARTVARLTLLHDSFAELPYAVREGRRVIANLERVAAFFLTKTVYAMVLALMVAARMMPYPLLPRQFSLIGLLAIGLPAFALSFAPSAERARTGFIRRTLQFAAPAGLVAGLASYAAFELALAGGSSLADSRTVATILLLGTGLWIVGRIARPLQLWKLGLIGLLICGAAAAFLLPLGRTVYGLELIDLPLVFESLATTAVAIVALEIALFATRIVGGRVTRLHATAGGERPRRGGSDDIRPLRPSDVES